MFVLFEFHFLFLSVMSLFLFLTFLSLSSGSESYCDDVPEVSDFLDFFSDSDADSVRSGLSFSELFLLLDLF